MDPKATVIYDPDCGFCRWCLAILLTWDGRPQIDGSAEGKRRDRARGEREGAEGERPSGSELGRPSPPQLPVRWGRSAAPGALRPLPLGSPEADALLADLAETERDASWHLILDDTDAPIASMPPSPAEPEPSAASGSSTDALALPRDVRFSAGAALAPALSLLPGGRIPAALFARFPRATERAYRWVADHRGLLGRFVGARARRWADRVIAAHGGPPPTQ